jgi:lysophospholipase L1-like esterase
MRRLIILFVILLSFQHSFSQSKLQVTHDTIRVINAELIIGNSTRSIQGYLYNTGNGVTQFRPLLSGKNIQFKSGDAGYPKVGDTAYSDTGLVNRTIKVWRNGLLQYRDLTDGIMADSTVGKVIFHPALKAGDRIYVEALSNITLVYTVSSTPSFTTNLTGLNTGTFDNGNNTFTLRWATNNTTLTASPRVLGVGSSTLAGYNVAFPNRLGDKINAWLTSNTSSPTWINLAVAGYNSGNVLPTALGGVVGHDIDSALAANPDFIFISLPSNDPAAGISVAQSMSNYRIIDTMSLNRGVIVFWETSQPRTAYNATQQAQLKLLADSVRAAWPTRFIEGFKNVVDSTNANPAVILSQYDNGDGIHLNSAGNQFIANSIFSRWQNYFVPVTGVTGYIVETSADGLNWIQLDNITDGNTVKKIYNRPDNQVHYYRVKAQYANGTLSAYSNVSQLRNVTTTIPPPPPSGSTANTNRVLIDLGGDGVTTLNSAGVVDGKPSPSPDSTGKYWNNWFGKGGATGFVDGSAISQLVTAANQTSSLSLYLSGNPYGTFAGGSAAKGINYNGFTISAGGYPLQSMYDNMFLNSSIGTTGVSLTIRGLARANTYNIKLWGARLDVTATPRTLETKLSTEDWTSSKTVNTRYAPTDVPNPDNAINYSNITGVDSLVINMRVASGSSFGHISFIDITASDTIRNLNPSVTLVRDTSITLPATSIQLAASVKANGATISGYQWTQLSGPSISAIVNATSVSTTINSLTNGLYTYLFTVATSTGSITDTVSVSVYPNNNGQKTLRAYFSNTQAPAVPGWFNVHGPVNGNHITVTDLVTSWTVDNGGSTTAYWLPFGSANGADNAGQTTGNNSGVMPDIVLNDYWFNSGTAYTSGTNNLILGGLNPAKTYTLTLVGSRNTSAAPPRYSSWHINNGSELLQNASGNTSNSTIVNNVQPDANGKISIGVYSPSNVGTYGSFSYINGLIIQEN